MKNENKPSEPLRGLSRQLPRNLRSLLNNIMFEICDRLAVPITSLSANGLQHPLLPRQFSLTYDFAPPGLSAAVIESLLYVLKADFPELFWVNFRPVFARGAGIAIKIHTDESVIYQHQIEQISEIAERYGADFPAFLTKMDFRYADEESPVALCEGAGNCFAVARLVKLALDTAGVPNIVARTADKRHCFNQLLIDQKFVFYDYFAFQKTGVLWATPEAVETCFDPEESFESSEVFEIQSDEMLLLEEELEAQLESMAIASERTAAFACLNPIDEGILQRICHRIGARNKHAFVLHCELVDADSWQYLLRFHKTWL